MGVGADCSPMEGKNKTRLGLVGGGSMILFYLLTE